MTHIHDIQILLYLMEILALQHFMQHLPPSPYSPCKGPNVAKSLSSGRSQYC